MARIKKPEVNPEFEHILLREMEPFAVESYDRHMATGPRKGAASDDVSPGTFDHRVELYEAAGLPVLDHTSAELVDAVCTSFDEHMRTTFEENGVDARPVIARAGSINQTTESGLVHFYQVQEGIYRDYPVFLGGLRRWTTEEKFHEPLIAAWGDYSGAINQQKVHADSASMNMNGIVVPAESVVSLKAFTHPQENLTGDAHTIFASVIDRLGARPMRKMGGQEFRHGTWFEADGKVMYEIAAEDPQLLEYVLMWEAYLQANFAMPAHGSYADFEADALMNAVCGMFTNEMVMKRQAERIQKLGLLDLDAGTDQAKIAQEALANHIDIEKNRLYRFVTNTVEKARQEYIDREKAAGRVPFLLGRTVIAKQGQISILPDAA